MSWTPDKEEKLRALWKKGYPASQISTMLGDTTRNAVIGKANRLNLEARNTSKKNSTKASSETNSNSVKPDVKTQKLGRKARFKALLLDKNCFAKSPEV